MGPPLPPLHLLVGQTPDLLRRALQARVTRRLLLQLLLRLLSLLRAFPTHARPHCQLLYARSSGLNKKLWLCLRSRALRQQCVQHSPQTLSLTNNTED